MALAVVFGLWFFLLRKPNQELGLEASSVQTQTVKFGDGDLFLITSGFVEPYSRYYGVTVIEGGNSANYIRLDKSEFDADGLWFFQGQGKLYIQLDGENEVFVWAYMSGETEILEAQNFDNSEFYLLYAIGTFPG